MSRMRTLMTGMTAAFVLLAAGCPAPPGTTSAPSGDGAAAGKPAPAKPAGTHDLSAQSLTVHHLSRELVHLMDDVHRHKLVDVYRISDMRNELQESLTWIDQLTPAQLSKFRGASDKVTALIEELRANPAAAGNAGLKSRLEKIEELNAQLKKAFPAE